MRVLLVVTMLVMVTSTIASFSTMFPFFFTNKSTPRPRSQGVSMTNTVRREFTRRTTDFFGKKRKEKKKTRLQLQVSLGPMVFPESMEETTPLNEIKVLPIKIKSKSQPKTTTTTETPDYEEYHESEEEILSQGLDPVAIATTTPKSAFVFFKKLKDKFPKIHDWLYEENNKSDAESKPREPRMPKTFNLKKKPKHFHHKSKTTYYGDQKKPNSKLIPPKKFAHAQRPTPIPKIRKPKQTTAPVFEREEDIQPVGFTQAPKLLPRPSKRKPKPQKITFEQYPAQSMKPFEQEQNILPAGQLPAQQNNQNYQKPQEINREVYFYGPPHQFAPSKAKPTQQKPLLQPKKQYKIIFIKAPEPEPPIIPDIPQIQPAPEQKTLIYVVAKKPEDPPKITINAPVGTSTEKPDVFFIRYKVTTTTPAPDNEQQVLPAGFFTTSKPKSGYKYPKPKPTSPPVDENEEEILPGGQYPTESPDESEEEVLPGGQEPSESPNTYLPPDENEEELLPGGVEPNNEYLPPIDEETKDGTLPGGQEPTEPLDENEEEILPGGQFPTTPIPTNFTSIATTPASTYYLPPKPYPSNEYLPPPPPPSYGQPLTPSYGPSYIPPPTSPFGSPPSYGQQLIPSYGPSYVPPPASLYGSPPAPTYNPPSVQLSWQNNGYNSQSTGNQYIPPSNTNYNFGTNSYVLPSKNYNFQSKSYTPLISNHGVSSHYVKQHQKHTYGPHRTPNYSPNTKL